MNQLFTSKLNLILFFNLTIIMLVQAKENIVKSYKDQIQISTINSILEIQELLEQASPNTLIVFDIGETLVVQKNNLLRAIRNYRIFSGKDVQLTNRILSKFTKQDHNARNIILSNMLVNSPLYLVEPEIKSIINNLQKRQIKVIAHCSSKVNSFGVIQNFQEWRYSVLKELGIDFRSSFSQNELSLTSLKGHNGCYPFFYNGILFGGTPKAKGLLDFIDNLKYQPSEIIYIDDCEVFLKSYARALKKRNINFKGFLYQAALQQTPKLNANIVNVQVKYMKRQKFIDDITAERILNRCKKH